MDEQVSRMYGFVRGRQLEGTFPGDARTGTWLVTGMRVAHGWGCPSEIAWPYDGDPAHWPPVVPEGIDALAKARRIGAYQRIRSIDDARVCIASQHPVVMAIPITKQWFAAPGGLIEGPGVDRAFICNHAAVIVGYDDSSQQLTFRNSWGETWGDGGHGYLPYDYFNRHLLEAWAITGPYDERPEERSSPRDLELAWGVPDLLNGTLHGVDLYRASTDDFFGWALGVVREGFLDVEELFVKADQRCRGYGTQLVDAMSDRARQLSLPLRFWIPFADVTGPNLARFTRIARRKGLRISRSNVSWAAYSASAG
jgi:GNAT superfamily N-acetyltransferase